MTIPEGPEHELAILFLHHDLDEVTLNNLESFRLRNPGVPIIPISGGKRMAGGIAPEDLPTFSRLHSRFAGTHPIAGKAGSESPRMNAPRALARA